MLKAKDLIIYSVIWLQYWLIVNELALFLAAWYTCSKSQVIWTHCKCAVPMQSLHASHCTVDAQHYSGIIPPAVVLINLNRLWLGMIWSFALSRVNLFPTNQYETAVSKRTIQFHRSSTLTFRIVWNSLPWFAWEWSSKLKIKHSIFQTGTVNSSWRLEN